MGKIDSRNDLFILYNNFRLEILTEEIQNSRRSFPKLHL